MRIVINNVTYSAIKNLSFAPETDIVNDSLAINEFSVEIITDDVITVGSEATLMDDRTTDPWMIGMVVFAEELKTGTMTVKVQSWLRSLDARRLKAVMYSNKLVSEIIDHTFGSTAYYLDSSFASLTISGYVPRQSARERLQWVCLIIGAYVKSYNNSVIEIVPLDQTTTETVPIDKTFWRPAISRDDYVGEIIVTAYSFATGTPATGDKTVKANGVTYIVSEQEYSLINPNLPQGIEGKTVEVSGVYLISADNVSAVLSFLSTLYFNRVSADVDVINNREYFPGDRVQFYLDADRMAVGFIESCSFSFGLQARSRLKINGIDELSSANLIINYLLGDVNLAKKTYRFPVGYAYDIENLYPDLIGAKHRYVYRPLNARATGTIIDGENVDNEDCELALHFYFESDVLLILSVTGIDETESGSGVIAIE